MVKVVKRCTKKKKKFGPAEHVTTGQTFCDLCGHNYLQRQAIYKRRKTCVKSINPEPFLVPEPNVLEGSRSSSFIVARGIPFFSCSTHSGREATYVMTYAPQSTALSTRGLRDRTQNILNTDLSKVRCLKAGCAHVFYTTAEYMPRP